MTDQADALHTILTDVHDMLQQRLAEMGAADTSAFPDGDRAPSNALGSHERQPGRVESNIEGPRRRRRRCDATASRQRAAELSTIPSAAGLHPST